MKNLFFGLAFMLMGTFAFANTGENKKPEVLNNTETITEPKAEIGTQAVSENESVSEAADTCIAVGVCSCGAVLVAIYDC